MILSRLSSSADGSPGSAASPVADSIFRPAHLCPDHLLFYWDSSAGAPAKEQQKLISALKTGDRVEPVPAFTVLLPM